MTGRLLIALFVLSNAAAVCASENGKAVGFVMHVVGTWVREDQPSVHLAPGDQLPAGSVVRPEPDGESSYRLTVSLYTGEIAAYHGRTSLPPSLEPSLVSRVWAAVSGRYNDRFARAMSRGSGVEDGVAVLANGTLTLRQELRPAQGVALKFHFLAEGGQAGVSVGPVLVSSTGGYWTVSSPVLREGLWRVTVYDGADAASEPTGEQAWVLVVAPSALESVEAGMADAQRLLRAAKAPLAPGVESAFLRAWLRSMAADVEGGVKP